MSLKPPDGLNENFLPAVPTETAALPVFVDDYMLVATNASAAIQLAIDAATLVGTVNGGIIFQAGATYDYGTGTTPYLYRNVGCDINLNDAVLKLSATAPRAFDFHAIAPGDLFTDIVIHNGTVDADSVGGKHHVIIGTYINGSNQTYINLKHIYVRRVNTVNVTSAPLDGDYAIATNHRLNVHFAPRQNNINGSQAMMEIEDVWIEDCRFEGGNEGAFIGMHGSPGYSDCIGDQYGIRRCWHDTGAVPTQYFPSANFQLGSYCKSRRFSIEDCWGFNSGDVGIEVDGADHGIINDCHMQDGFNANYYLRGFAPTFSGLGATYDYNGCISEHISLSSDGWLVAGIAGGATFDSITLRGCRERNDCGETIVPVVRVPSIAVKRLLLDDFRTVQTNADISSVSASTPITVSFTSDGTATECHLIIRNSEIKVQGERTGAGACTYSSVQLYNGTFVLDIDDLRTEYDIVNSSAGGNVGLNFPNALSTTIKTGSVRRYQPVQITGPADPRGALFGGTTNLTINSLVRFRECDFSGLPVGGTELSFFTTGATNRPRVSMEDCEQRTGASRAVAAAAAQTLPMGYRCVVLTGTTTVTSIAAEAPDTVRMVQFSDALPGGMTDGSNLRLASSWAPTTSDSILLACTDGVNWTEISRSGNI